MKILFIGNSYTYFNEMPEQLGALMRENGFDVTVHSVTKGGRKLREYADIADTYRDAIDAYAKEGGYDVLILQEQSFYALIDRAEFIRGVRELKGKVGAKRTVLYATWGRGDGCPLLDEHGWTRESMTEGLAAAYAEAAELISGEVSAVGRAFYRMLELYPETTLYTDDLSHPSKTGTALGVLTHYKTITGSLPEKYTSLALSDELVQHMLEVLS